MRSTQEFVHVDCFGWARIRRVATMIVIIHACLAGLLIVGLLCGGILDGLARIAATAVGVAAGVGLTRLRNHGLRIVLCWTGLLGVLALIVPATSHASLLAIAPALYLMANLEDFDDMSWKSPHAHISFGLVVWVCVILVLGRHTGWMVIFAAGAAVQWFAKGRRGLATLLAAGVVIYIAIALERRERLNIEDLFPLLRTGPAAIPFSWLSIREAGWLGDGALIALDCAAAPAIATRWGWIGLGFTGVMAAALPAAGILLVHARHPHPLVLSLIAMFAMHLLLHLLQIVGCPLHVASLPMLGPPLECLVYACLQVLAVHDLQSEFQLPRSGWRTRRTRRLGGSLSRL